MRAAILLTLMLLSRAASAGDRSPSAPSSPSTGDTQGKPPEQGPAPAARKNSATPRRKTAAARKAPRRAGAPLPYRKPRRSLAEFMPDYSSAPSYRYANLGRGACFEELATRKIVFRPVDEAPGVLAPVRIPSGVGGVRYRTGLDPKKASTSPFEVFDCRLVLALDDLSAILRPHGIDDVVIFSGWRPPGKAWPKGKAAQRHPGGLAVDVKTLRSTHDAELRLEVESDYGGKIGASSCGPSAVAPEEPTTKTVLLREVVCEVVASRIFTSVLTPNHDEAHRNHLHLDLATGVTWRIVR